MNWNQLSSQDQSDHCDHLHQIQLEACNQLHLLELNNESITI